MDEHAYEVHITIYVIITNPGAVFSLPSEWYSSLGHVWSHLNMKTSALIYHSQPSLGSQEVQGHSVQSQFLPFDFYSIYLCAFIINSFLFSK